MPTVEDLGKAVKAKYPGAYDDMPDGDLGVRIQKKYPGAYDDYGPVAPTVGPPKALGQIESKMSAPSAMDTAGKVAKGAGSAFVNNLDPRNYLHPIDSLKADAAERAPLRAKAIDDFKNGKYSDAVQNYIEGAVPIAGPIEHRGLNAPDPESAGREIGNAVSLKAVPALTDAVIAKAPAVVKGAGVAAKTGVQLAKNAVDNSTVIQALKDAHAQATGKAPVVPPRTAPIPAVKYRPSAPEAPAAPIPAVSYRPQEPSAPAPTPPPVSYRPAPAEAPVAAVPPVNYKPTPTPEAGPTAPPPPLKPMNRSVAAEPATPAPAPTSTVARAPRPSDEYYKVHAQVKKAMTSSQELFKQGITAKQLSELAPEERAKALGKNSEETFNRILFELRGLETGKVKSQ